MNDPILAVDINADVGEGIGNEPKLLPLLSSCNIACGGHAGTLQSMKEVVQLAISNGIKIGAHPSFPDTEHFGRRIMDLSNADLYATLKSQILSLSQILKEEGGSFHHVKPHGALYNLAAKDDTTAKVLVAVMGNLETPVSLYVPYGSVISKIASREGIPIIYEAFADRNYNPDLSLVSRDEKNAIIEDPEIMFNHVFNMVKNKKVKTVNGVEVPIQASTFCVHGDHPNTLDLVLNLRAKLISHGIVIL